MYNFAFHETSLLEEKSTVTYKKIDLVRTSLVTVLCDKLSDLPYLKKLLDNSLPKYAQLDVLVFLLNLKKEQVDEKLGIFAQLINEKKIRSVKTCQVILPKASHNKLQQRRVQLNGNQFAQYLQI
jgi:hypothetical protein